MRGGATVALDFQTASLYVRLVTPPRRYPSPGGAPLNSGEIGMTAKTHGPRLTLILGALTAFAPLTIDIYLPSLPTLVRYFGTTDAAVQLTMPVFFIGLALGQLFYGPLSDRFGRRPPLLAGIALYVLASAACALAPSIETLLVGRFVQALGGCAGMTIAMAIVRDRYDPREGARTLSLLRHSPPAKFAGEPPPGPGYSVCGFYLQTSGRQGFS
jgi:Major Facilitator Superfamily